VRNYDLFILLSVQALNIIWKLYA